MDASGTFKVPSMMAQDLAVIMGFVDPPQPMPNLQETRELLRGQKRKVSPNIVSKTTHDAENDLSSSFTESEDEVEAQIAVTRDAAGTLATTGYPMASSSSDEDESDSQSSSSESSSTSSSHQRQQSSKRITLPTVHVDNVEDEILTPAAYMPTTHELPPTAVPVPSLPDPATLPQVTLELVGEIVTVLSDSVTVRGSGLLNASARERRDAALDEGSLLLLDDRTPLGYVWETFGPTTLPHYLVRIKRRESAGNTHLSHASVDDAPETLHGPSTASESEENSQSMPSSTSSSIRSSYDSPDPTKLFISRAIYHIPSLSTFVFPGALAGSKGSDASNIHDEEPAEHELDFSDDEAEAKYKRHRGSYSRAPSQTPFSDMFDGEGDDATSTVGDEASSLYGASPYDFKDVSPSSNLDNHGIPSSPNDPGTPVVSPSLTSFEDAAVRDALVLARNSRHRRNSSVSISRGSVASGPAQPREQDHQFHNLGGRGGRRGKDRRRFERGRERNSRGQPRERGRGRGQGGGPEWQGQASSFSFEEYDPHMPRPPSPTSLAIAHATGQWADGAPFPYGATAVNSSGSSIDSGPAMHFGQVSQNMPNQVLMHYTSGSYTSQGDYHPTFNVSQSLDYQSSQVPNYGVAPHINPRFTQTFHLPNAMQTLPTTPQNITFPPSSLNPLHPRPQPEANEAEPVSE